MDTDTPLFREHEQPQLGQILAKELKKYPWSGHLERFYPRLRATDNAILEVPDGSQFFSNTLWDLCFRRLQLAELWHYTSLETLVNIIQSKEIWLHPLSLRMCEGELTRFAGEFDYRGLLDFDDQGNRIAETFARDLFYLSLTDADAPGDFWGYGEVRLRLAIETVSEGAMLRQISYGGVSESDHPLRVLKEFAQRRFNRAFVPWQVSRTGAFFLDSYYSWESETRLLVKRFEGTTDLEMRESQGTEAVAVRIGMPNDRVVIDLKRIELETPRDLAEARRRLQSHPEWLTQLSVCT